MTESAPRISAHHAVEQVLAARAAEDPNFVHQLLLDPKAIIQPILASAVGDDTLDLSDVAVNVQFESEKVLHFNVPLMYADAEVSGFALPGATGGPRIEIQSGGWGKYRGIPCDLTMPPMGGSPGSATNRTGHPALCATDAEIAEFG